MERLIERRLLEWRDSPDRKPLVLLGIRQCGKTYILREFGERHYSKVAYFDFESMSELRSLFWNLDVRRIVEDLSRKSGVDIDGDTLCVHGDGPKALAFVERIRKAFQEEGIQIRNFL